ncbi:MAG: hypothetical protein PHQ43_00070 [Dehalococcoidales bacterium]|nr:hypothetical protein [Dehalococcoidales bacterium]
MDKFYMVYGEDRKSPTVKHPTFENAKAEAERLALKEGVPFYVLESQTVSVPYVTTGPVGPVVYSENYKFALLDQCPKCGQWKDPAVLHICTTNANQTEVKP